MAPPIDGQATPTLGAIPLSMGGAISYSRKGAGCADLRYSALRIPHSALAAVFLFRQPDFDLPGAGARVVGRDGVGGRATLDGTVGDVELATVPGAGDGVAFQFAFPQRAAKVRADAVE